MSNREKCIAILDSFNDGQLANIATMLQTVKQTIEDALATDTPNATTVAAMRELDNGGGELWTGSTKDLFTMLDAEDGADA